MKNIINITPGSNPIPQILLTPHLPIPLYNLQNNYDINNHDGPPTPRALRPAQLKPKAYRHGPHRIVRSTKGLHSQPADNMEEYLESYKLHQNFFTKEDMRSQPSFTMVKGKNYMYFGGFVDHMKHGYGLLVAGDTIY